MTQFDPLFVAHFSPLLEEGDSGAPCHPLLVADWGVQRALANVSAEVRPMVIGRLKEIADMVEQIAQRMQVPAPAMVLSRDPRFKGFGAASHLPPSHIKVEGDFKQAISIDLRFIEGLGALCGNHTQARDVLRLNGEELYAVLAHEMGHLKNHHNRQDQGYRTPSLVEQMMGVGILARMHNHSTEFSADATMIKAGADPEAFTRAVLKITRDMREKIMKPDAFDENFGVNEVRQHRCLANRTNITAKHITKGGNTHPPLIERHEALQTQTADGKTWQERWWWERRAIRQKAQEERGSGRE